MADKLAQIQPWYQEGLPFKCTECGQRCTGTSGYVWVTEEEVSAIASFLNLRVEQFTRKYIRQAGERLALVERKVAPETYDCVFLKDKKCTIYPVRPKQCQTYPWWPENLSSREAWAEAAKGCEGIHPDAPVVPYKTIVTQLQ